MIAVSHWIAEVRTRWSRRLTLLLLIAGGIAAVATGSPPEGESGGPAAAPELMAEVSLSASVSASLDRSSVPEPLTYQINTKYGTTPAACAVADVQTVDATMGVAEPVDVGGLFLPDISVLLTATPGAGNLPTTAELEIARLTLGTLYTRVEVVVTPEAGEPGRVAFGYDGCTSGAPASFTATVLHGADRLNVNAVTLGAPSSLAVFGALYGEGDGRRVDPTSVRADMAPVPNVATLDLTFLPDDDFHATLQTSEPTELAATYRTVSGKESTEVDAVVREFPGALTLDFGDEEISYLFAGTLGADLGSAIDRIKFELTQIMEDSKTGELTRNKATAALLDVPDAGKIRRDGADHVTYTVPNGAIGSATVSFESHKIGITPPGPPAPTGDQYFVADQGPDHTVAELRMLGLSALEIATDDTVIIDATHTAGPFDIAAKRTTIDDKKPTDPPVVREISGTVRDLPDRVRITFDTTTQTFTYRGSAVINELAANVTSSVPFVEDSDANRSEILLRGIPAGGLPATEGSEPAIEITLDAENSKLTGTIAEGSLGLLEITVTSGPTEDDRLSGEQGVLLDDKKDHYLAFARIRDLERVEVGWGETILADVTHAPGRFRVLTDQDKVLTLDCDLPFPLPFPDCEDFFDFEYTVTAEADITDLPRSAVFTYTPEDQAVTYSGTEEVAQVQIDATSGKPFVGRATVADIDIRQLKSLSFSVDESEKVDGLETGTGMAGTGEVGSIDALLTSGPKVRFAQGSDGLLFHDMTRTDGEPSDPEDDPYIIFARVTGLQRLDATLGDEHRFAAFGQEVMADAGVRTTGRRDFRVEIEKPDAAKPKGVEFTRVVYEDPPDEIQFRVLKGHKDDKHDDWFVVDYSGWDADESQNPNQSCNGQRSFCTPARGDSLTLFTNAGGTDDAGRHRTVLQARVEPVPSRAHAEVCPDRGFCSTGRDRPGGSEEVSFTVEVAEPVDLCVRDLKEVGGSVRSQLPPDICATSNGEFDFPNDYAMKLLEVDLPIPETFSIRKEKRGPTVGRAYFHTNAKQFPRRGRLQEWVAISHESGDSKTTRLKNFRFPAGFMAWHREVKIQCSLGNPEGGFDCDIKDGVTEGTMACPSGTVMTSKRNFAEDSVADVICPDAKPTVVRLASGGPAALLPGETAEIVVRGSGVELGEFSPTSCSGAFPPCAGPKVEIGEALPLGFIGVEVDSVTWDFVILNDGIDREHPVDTRLRFTFTVPDDAEPGKYDVFVTNPVAGGGLCEDCVTVLDPNE